MTSGAFVKGFPSREGVYILNCFGIELDFLGLDRFETALPTADPTEECTLCQMRLLDAVWWPSIEKYTIMERRPCRISTGEKAAFYRRYTPRRGVSFGDGPVG
jgi:hypothetical protein